MRQHSTRTASVWAAVCAGALTLAACGGGDGSEADATVPASATAGAATTTAATEITEVTEPVDVTEESGTTDETTADAEQAETTEIADSTVPTESTQVVATTQPAATETTTTTAPTTASTTPSVEATPAAQRLRDAAAATLALTSFESVLVADQVASSRTENITALAAFDYDALVGSVDFTVVEGDTTDSVVILADGESFWMRVLDRDLDALPNGRTWITGSASLLRAGSAQFEPANTLGALAGLLVVDAPVVSLGADTTADGIAVERFEVLVDYDAAYEVERDLSSVYAVDLRRTGAVMDIDVAIDADGIVREFGAVVTSSEAPELSASYVLTVSSPGSPIAAPEPPDPSLVAIGPEADALLDQYFG